MDTLSGHKGERECEPIECKSDRLLDNPENYAP